jgi:two-component system, response regulator PdtaR
MNILVAEDEALIALWLSSLIEEAGHRLIGTCKSLEEAKRLAAANPPDMGIIDLRLGNKRCGASIDAHLAEAFGTTSIYLTANRAFAHTYRRHAIGFIEKPIDGRAVMEAMAYVEDLRRGRAPPAPDWLTLFEPIGAGLITVRKSQMG